MQLKTILRQVPDPRGKQGQDYMLWSILSLIVVSLLCGRRGMKAAFLLGRSLSRRQKAELGFIRGTTPCHATLTETLRVIDAQALADVLGALFLEQRQQGVLVGLQLLQRLALDARHETCNEPARCAHLDYRDQRAIEIKGGERPAQIVRLALFRLAGLGLALLGLAHRGAPLIGSRYRRWMHPLGAARLIESVVGDGGVAARVVLTAFNVPPSAAVRQRSIALITFIWSRLT